MTRQEILQARDRIECELSPENLHCDGEISHAQARVKYNRLIKERNRLEKLLSETIEDRY